MHKNNGKVNIALFAAAVLLCLTLLTTHLTSGLYARYTTSASGSDSARVAKWSVDFEMQNASMVLTSNKEYEERTITLKNNSEVAARFDMTVTVTANEDETLPSGVTVSVDGQRWAVSGGAGNASHTFSDVATLAPGKTRTVQLRIDSGSGEDNYGCSVSVSVQAEQVD